MSQTAEIDAGDSFNQEGVPPAVEAPAAGSLQPFGGITIRADEPNIVIEGLGRPDLSIGSELSDMTALARRLAEMLKKAAVLLDGYSTIEGTALDICYEIHPIIAEARKHKLIE